MGHRGPFLLWCEQASGRPVFFYETSSTSGHGCVCVLVAMRSGIHSRVISVTSTFCVCLWFLKWAFLFSQLGTMSSVLTVLHNTSRLELQVRAACFVFVKSARGWQWLARVSCPLAGRAVEEVMLRQHLRSPRQRHHVHVFCHSAGGVSHREATGILVKSRRTRPRSQRAVTRSRRSLRGQQA